MLIWGPDSLHVIIDTREKQWLKEWLPLTYPQHTFELKALKEGDFLSNPGTNREVLVERKTVEDLYQSKYEGRLDKQLSRLTAHHNNKLVMLLITGSPEEFIKKMRKPPVGIVIPPGLIDSIIASVLVRDNVRVLVDSDEETALRRMIAVMEKVEDGNLGIPKIRNEDMLAARLCMITPEQWFTLKEKHGSSLVHIASLNERDLTEIKGVGKVKAKRVKEILNHGWE